MNILIAIESFYDGGAEMAAIRLANELAKTQNKIKFIELESNYSKEKKQKELLSQKVRLFQPDRNLLLRFLIFLKRYLPFPIGIFNRFIWFVKRNLVNFYLYIHSIEIVNSHYIFTDEYFGTCKHLGFKLVATFHGHYEIFNEQLLGPDFRNRIKKILSKVDHIVYTSSRHVETLKEYNFSISKTSKINYVFSNDGVGSPIEESFNDDLKISMVSRAIAEKGWEEMIQAVILLNNKYHNKINLRIIGDGEKKNELKSKYAQHKFIQFLGHKSQVEIMQLLNQSHLAVLPSYYKAESMPNAIIEYLACGKPVIATNVGAVKEMLSTKDNQLVGILVELHHGKVEKCDLANAIEQYIFNPDLMAKHANLAKEAFKKFGGKINAIKYLELFESLIK